MGVEKDLPEEKNSPAPKQQAPTRSSERRRFKPDPPAPLPEKSLIRNRRPTNRAGGYAGNSWLAQWGWWWGGYADGDPEWVWTKEAQILHPSKTPDFADGVMFWYCWPRETDLPAINLQTGQPWGPWGMETLTIPRHGSRPTQVTTNQPPKERLPGAINISFYDGHAAMTPLESLWQQEWHQGWKTPARRPGL